MSIQNMESHNNTTEFSLKTLFPRNKSIDCITIGRANVDLYPPIGKRLDNTRNYEAFVGGSPANIAAGISRLGLSSAIITRVAHDLHGKFVINYLSKNFNIDCTMVQYDNSGAKTSLAFAERCPDAHTIMYRNNSADLHLDSNLLDREYIAKARALCISGTALTTKTSRDAVITAIHIAKTYHIPCIMDIDYRPYGWSSYTEAAKVLSSVAEKCDIVIGTEEEFTISNVLDTTKDTHIDHKKDVAINELIKNLFQKECKIAVLKKGSRGSICYLKDNRIIEGVVFTVKPVKPWGAGDAFASAFISYLLLDESIEHALEAGAAAASINITGLSCTEAMPTRKDLEAFINKYKQNI